MELRVLRYFLMVVDERNISRAAEKLHVSQPTISRQLHELEDELGVTLFERGQRAIALTEAGAYFVQQARQIVGLADKTVANVQQTREVRGSVAIGCAEAPMMRTIARAVTKLQQVAPQVTVNLASMDAHELQNRMRAGLLDFGVVMEPNSKDGYHFRHLPGGTAWGLLVRRDDPLATRSTISAADLDGQRLIMSQQRGSVALLTDWLGSSAHHFEVVATYNLLYNASLLVAAGAGSALCLAGIIDPAVADLRFVPLTPALSGHASLVWPQTRQLSAAAQAFLQAVEPLTAAAGDQKVQA